jgi:hypothetical protein
VPGVPRARSNTAVFIYEPATPFGYRR